MTERRRSEVPRTSLGFKTPEPTADEYRAQVRETLRGLSDHALSFQDTTVMGGIDREELDREIERRRAARREAWMDEQRRNATKEDE